MKRDINLEKEVAKTISKFNVSKFNKKKAYPSAFHTEPVKKGLDRMDWVIIFLFILLFLFICFRYSIINLLFVPEKVNISERLNVSEDLNHITNINYEDTYFSLKDIQIKYEK